MLRRTRLVVGTVYEGRGKARLEIVELPKETYGGRLNGRIEVERTLPARSGRSPRHFHADFSETYLIRSGVADAYKRGERMRLKAGDTFKSGQYVDHVNPHNNSGALLTFTQIIDPATEAALAYVNTLAHALIEARDDRGELPRLAVLAVFDRLDGETWVSGVPVPVQRRLLPVMGRIARRRHPVKGARLS